MCWITHQQRSRRPNQAFFLCILVSSFFRNTLCYLYLTPPLEAVIVTSGTGLALALADPRVTDIMINNSLELMESDYYGLGKLPIILSRNVTIYGSPQRRAMDDLITLNGNYVKDKVQLDNGMTLTLTGLVLTRYREDMPASTPGIDLLAKTPARPGLALPLMYLVGIALNNRFCFPPLWARKSADTLGRPDFWPGKNNITGDLPQPNCLNDTTAPWLQRCYPVRRHYHDVGTPGAMFNDAGQQEYTNYYVRALDVPLLCTGVMPKECADQLTPLGCYYHFFPKKQSPPQPAIPSIPSPELPPLPPRPLVLHARPRKAAVLGIALGGGLGGGVVLVVAILVYIYAALRGRTLCAEGPVGAEKTGKGDTSLPRPQDEPPGLKVITESAEASGMVNAAMREVPSWLCACLTGGRGDIAEQTFRSICDPSLRPRHADPTLPITPLTPIRPDVKLLASDMGQESCEVVLLPGAARGKGSFGRVMEGMYKGQRVAVKVVADMHQWAGPSQSLLKSFVQEVEVLGRCNHPNVVRLLAACLKPPRLCVVMELMEASLEQLLYARSPGGAPLPLHVALHIAIQIAQGLEYLHPTIVHRDLKPANVLLNGPWSDRPVVKVADFGLARLRSTPAPTNTPEAGTPAYLAPECLESSIITDRADIYSLGVLLWELLSGSKPWRGRSMIDIACKTARGDRLPLSALPDSRCPPPLRRLILRCWEADPRRRPAAAECVKYLALMLQKKESNGSIPILNVVVPFTQLETKRVVADQGRVLDPKRCPEDSISTAVIGPVSMVLSDTERGSTSVEAAEAGDAHRAAKRDAWATADFTYGSCNLDLLGSLSPGTGTESFAQQT